MIAFDAPSFSERMKNGGRSLCRAGEPVNKPHGQINRQNAEKKQGGIAYESKNETYKAVERAAVLCHACGNLSNNCICMGYDNILRLLRRIHC